MPPLTALCTCQAFLLLPPTSTLQDTAQGIARLCKVVLFLLLPPASTLLQVCGWLRQQKALKGWAILQLCIRLCKAVQGCVILYYKALQGCARLCKVVSARHSKVVQGIARHSKALQDMAR